MPDAQEKVDARAKLQQAIAAKRGKGPPGGSQPKPQDSAPQAQSRPEPPPRSAPRTQTASTSRSGASRKQAKKKTAKQKKGGGFFAKQFQSFVKNIKSEFQDITKEISPGAILSSATDSLKGFRNILGNQEEDAHHEAEREPSEPSARTAHRTPSEADDAPPPAPETADASLPDENSLGAASAPQKKPKETESAREPTSPAKVRQQKKKKNKATESLEALEAMEDTDVSWEELGARRPAEPEAPPEAPAQHEDQPESQPEEQPEQHADETEAPAEEAETAPSPDAPQEGASAPSAPEDKPAQQAPKPASKPPPRTPAVKLSKTEQALRSLRSLQAVLNNPIWGPIITQPQSRPTVLYAPRERFDTNFADPTFKEGLKAASRLASSFAFSPEKMGFEEKAIEVVQKLQIDPDGRIKKDNDQLSKVLPEDTIKAMLGLLNTRAIRKLLYSVGTRLGTFVPTIEILARIYLGLRRREWINHGDRLHLQEEVVMRYAKAPYTEDMAKKARNLALNYYLDYLLEYSMKLYKERFEAVPEGQNNIQSHYRRHEIIKAHCFNVLDDFGKKASISPSMLAGLKDRFTETSDRFLEDTVGGLPEATQEAPVGQ